MNTAGQQFDKSPLYRTRLSHFVAYAAQSLSRAHLWTPADTRCVCVYRNGFIGVHGVTGCRFTSLLGPGCWRFDLLCQKDTTCEKVREVATPDSSFTLTVVSDMLSDEPYFVPPCIADAFSPPRDNPTHCFRQAAHEAAQASVPHTSAGPYLWSLQLPKPANLCLHPGRLRQR